VITRRALWPIALLVTACSTAALATSTASATSAPSGGAPPAAATPDAATPTAVSQGQVLLSDSFDDPSIGKLRKASTDTGHYTVGYLDGEFQIKQVDPEWGSFPVEYLPGTYVDTTLSVDVRLAGDTKDRYVVVGCRSGSNPSVDYRFQVEPDTGEFKLARYGDGKSNPLVDWQASSAIQRGNAKNTLGLTCSGPTIAGSVNGTQVASVQDTTLTSGQLFIGASAFTDAHVNVDGRFDNLVVSAPH